jgi:hypothetical protein
MASASASPAVDTIHATMTATKAGGQHRPPPDANGRAVATTDGCMFTFSGQTLGAGKALVGNRLHMLDATKQPAAWVLLHEGGASAPPARVGAQMVHAHGYLWLWGGCLRPPAYDLCLLADMQRMLATPGGPDIATVLKYKQMQEAHYAEPDLRVWKFNLTSREWSVAEASNRQRKKRAVVPPPREKFAACVLGDAEMLVVGGAWGGIESCTDEANFLAARRSLWSFSFSTHTWRCLHDGHGQPSSRPDAHKHALFFAIDGTAYLYGGEDADNRSRQELWCWAHSHGNSEGAWRRLANAGDAPDDLSEASVTTLRLGNAPVAVVYGGYFNQGTESAPSAAVARRRDGYQSSAFVFRPQAASGLWSSIALASDSRSLPKLAQAWLTSVGETVVIAGGYGLPAASKLMPGRSTMALPEGNGTAVFLLELTSNVAKGDSPAPLSPATGPSGARHRSRIVHVGSRVILDGLVARSDLNGRKGVATAFDDAKQRFLVRVDDGPAAIGVKPSNLEVDLEVDLEGRPALDAASATPQGAEQALATTPWWRAPPRSTTSATPPALPPVIAPLAAPSAPPPAAPSAPPPAASSAAGCAGAQPRSRRSFTLKMITNGSALKRAEEGMIADLAKRMNGTLDAHTCKLRSLVRDIVVQTGARTPEEIWTVFLAKLKEVDGADADAPEKEPEQWELIEPVAHEILHEVYPRWYPDPGRSTGVNGLTAERPAVHALLASSDATLEDVSTPDPPAATAADAAVHALLASSDATLEDVRTALEQYASEASGDVLAELRRRRDRLKKKKQKKERRQQGETSAQAAMDASQPPDDYVCPITQDVMIDPVIAADGHTYERDAIARWFEGGKQTSPKSGAELETTALLPNHLVRRLILEWRESHGSREQDN